MAQVVDPHKLIEKLTGVAPAPKPGSNADLREQCKAAGIKGVSSLTKASLQASLAAGKAVKPAPRKPRHYGREPRSGDGREATRRGHGGRLQAAVRRQVVAVGLEGG